MKILVIDDSQSHQQSARQTLGADHDLTVVGSHDEALELVGEQYDKEWKKLPYPWDAVLCDLLMPAGRNAQGGKGMQYVGVEMPIGWSLAINAALNGAQYVAVVTDMSHHDHPASAMLDCMSGEIFTINGARALFTNRVGMVGIVGTERTCIECGGSGERKRGDGSTYKCYTCSGTGTDYAERGKDWADILAQLMKTDDPSS